MDLTTTPELFYGPSSGSTRVSWCQNRTSLTEADTPTMLIFPCIIKSRSSLLALAHPGGPEKRVVKWLWWWWCWLIDWYSLASPDMGHWDTCPPWLPTIKFFSVNFRAAQSHSYVVWLPVQTYLHFAWVVHDAKCIVVMRVCVSMCVSVCPRPYGHTTAPTRM